MNGNLYRCIVTNSAGSVNTDSAILTVQAAPPTITTQPRDTTVRFGQTAQFSVAANTNGGGALSYQWQISTNGGNVWRNVTTNDGAGVANATFTTHETTMEMSLNRYRCIVTNSVGADTSNVVILTVNLAENRNITTEAQLRTFATDVNNGTDFLGHIITLGNDITLTSAWTPIGDSTAASVRPFRGTFDGGGHTISGLSVSGGRFAGLFGYVGDGGQIRGVIVSVNELTTSAIGDRDPTWTGGLVGIYASTRAIENCGVIIVGSIHASSAGYSGGLVGLASAALTIRNSYAVGNISSTLSSGGLVGWADEAITISNSYTITNVSSVSAITHFSGGFVGYVNITANITNSYALGITTATGTGTRHIGGIYGFYSSVGSSNAQVHFNNTGVSNAAGNVTTISGITGRTPEQLRTRTTFSGWDFDDVWAINGGTPYLRNVTKTNVVSFNSNTGSTVGSITETTGAISFKPDNPTKEEYLFTGWFKESGLINTRDFDIERVTADITLFAKWNNPTVTTESHLRDFAIAVNVGHNNFVGDTITLGENIELANAWIPVGNLQRQFRGVFDGSEHSVTGLRVSDVEYAGLFGYVGANGQIKNLTVNVADITTRTSGTNYAGGLAGFYASTRPIENSVVNISDSIRASGTGIAGGLVGQTNAILTISDSYTTGNISSSTSSGGLVGLASAALTIRNSYAVGNISSTLSSGGLVGDADAAITIENSYTIGDIFSSGTSGGLVGRANAAITIRTSYTVGDVSSGSASGGLVGSAQGVLTINNSYTTGNVSATSSSWNFFAGGLVGSANSSSSITNSYVAGTISGTGSGTRGGISGTRSFSTHTWTSVYFNSQGNPTSATGNTTLTGLARTPEELRERGTFVGWNFPPALDPVWNMNNSFPFLRGVTVINTVKFESNGGSAVGDVTGMIGSIISRPTHPTKAGYLFVGWYKDAALTNPWNFVSDKVRADITLYAKWLSPTIMTEAQLRDFAALVNSGHNFLGQVLALGADIDLENKPWTPIGDTINQFRGTFDGGGKTISNLSVSGVRFAGLFGFVGANGQIKNLAVDVTTIATSTTANMAYAGGLAGFYASTNPIENSVVNISGSITASATTATASSGGLVGWASAALTIRNSYTMGNVSSVSGTFHRSGGLVGMANSSTTIINSYVNGTISATGSGTRRVGGIFGERAVTGTHTYTSVYFNSAGASAAAGSPTGAITGIVARTASRLKDIATFVNWNFDEIWGINEDINDGFPYLQTFVHDWDGDWNEWNTTGLTCTDAGISTRTRTCNIHDEVTQVKNIAALGHNMPANWVINEEPTCTTPGDSIRICTRENCVHRETKLGTALGHNMPANWVINEEPTCTTPGDSIRVCTRENCAHRETKLGTALGHNWGDWAITPATCTVAGDSTRVCLRGDSTEVRPIAALGHSWGSWVITPATCTVAGDSTRVCLRGDSTEVRPIAVLGHNWGSWVITPATCTVAGDSTRVCSRGDSTEVRPIAVLGHNWGSWVITPATCTVAGDSTRVCSRGDSTEVRPIAALGHNWGSWVITPATCTVAGDSTRVCLRGDSTEVRPIAALGHNWGSWSNWSIVSMATCTEAGSLTRARTCTTCNLPETETEEIPPLGHDWTPWVEVDTTFAGACICTETIEKRTCRRDGLALFRVVPLLRGSRCADDPNEPNEQENLEIYGIILENTVVSDMARIFVKTPEPATANITILDNLGNVVFTASTMETQALRLYGGTVSCRDAMLASPLANCGVVWNLRNTAGRLVANGTYLIIVEARGNGGRAYRYSARIGVQR